MGVLQCNRKGCDEIMCQTCIPGIGYICYDCKSEFQDKFERKFGDNDQSEATIESELRAFMGTRKASQESDTIVSTSDYFSKHQR